VTDAADDGVTVSRGLRAAEEVAVSRGLRAAVQVAEGVTVVADVGETVGTGVTPANVTVADAEKDADTDAEPLGVIDACGDGVHDPGTGVYVVSSPQ
jgi:hypothetical protein